MITTAILFALYGAITLILSPLLLLPDVSISSGVATAISNASSYVSILNTVLPVQTIVTFFLVFLAVELGIFTYKLIKWVYNKIPGIS